MSGLRLRRRPFGEVVQQFDAFTKVTENVQEEKRATGGFISVVSFLLIGWLVVGELRYFFETEFDYKFLVDVEFDETLKLEVDMVVAMSCDAIGADVTGSISDEAVMLDPLRNMLQQDPTRFEFTETEETYWNILRAAQREQLKPGAKNYQSLDDLTFVGNSVLRGLQAEAEAKQKEEAEKLRAKMGKDEGGPPFGFGAGGGIQIILGDGMGVFQLLAANPGNKGTACRIHGSVAVQKVTGNVHISPGKTMNIMGGGGHAHLRMLGADDNYNFSHRVERFSFGQRIPGLVMPLAGTEQISVDKMDLYQYYLKIVPTKVYRLGALGHKPITTYQYAVTHRKRAIDHTTGSHGTPGINIKYELSSVMIEVRERYRSFLQLLVRLCAIAGGVFATSGILNAFVQFFAGLCFPQSHSSSSPSSPDKQALLEAINRTKAPADRPSGELFVT
uniref:Endoplasmic reticulum-Golgi intermediate compartment protein 2 n=1 Tax=Plectus sambesii TaxID=2011161 RepID=A0A914V028_9BILA